jgi:hypothetical protein
MAELQRRAARKAGVSGSAIRRLRHPRWEDAMQRNTVRRTLGIAGVLALGSIAIAYAQQQTAPPASGTAPPAATAPVAPVTGRWPDVDCATSKLTTTASQPRCQRGPTFNEYAGDSGPGMEVCEGEQWTVATRSPSNFGFAKLANIRTPVPHCQVHYRAGIAAALKNNNVLAQNGTGWSDVNQIGGIYTASFTSAGGQTAAFTSVGGENCKAFLKLGPPWQGGSLWAVRGWLCGVQGNSVQDRDLQSFVDALVIKVP